MSTNWREEEQLVHTLEMELADARDTIDRLTRERDEARAKAIKVRWEGEHLLIGSYKIGWCWVRQSDCLAYLCNGVSKFLGGFPDEPSARAAVEAAAIEALTKEQAND